MVENQALDVSKWLEAASLLVPKEIATEMDITVDDVWEYLAQGEWEVALDLLEDSVTSNRFRSAFWKTLASAAEQMRFERSAAWCHWRCYETRNGIIRADLSFCPPAEARRRTAIPGAGVLPPMWNLGHLTAAGEPALDIARLWVEFAPNLEPGGQAPVRLAPLDPLRWHHLRPGQVITMHEDRSVAGTAVVLEVQRPTVMRICGFNERHQASGRWPICWVSSCDTAGDCHWGAAVVVIAGGSSFVLVRGGSAPGGDILVRCVQCHRCALSLDSWVRCLWGVAGVRSVHLMGVV